MKPTGFQQTAIALLIAVALMAPHQTRACSSCGCNISTDAGTQGLGTGTGWRADFRFDYFKQSQLRTGTGAVDRAGLALPAAREIQQTTTNRNFNAFLDYSPGADWGLTIQLPYYLRDHSTVAPGDTTASSSRSEGGGDMRVLGRYLGFAGDHSWGVQLGAKLPTGAIHDRFAAGPQAGATVDRGLQPGTGTTDLLAGAFKFGALNRDWDYFAQALLQLPLNSRESFRPGAGLNVNLGASYAGYEHIVPQIQLNARMEKRESGANADVDNSGATIAYLSPGALVNVSKSAQAFAFVQLPVYQRVNGYQLEPRYSISVGMRYSF